MPQLFIIMPIDAFAIEIENIWSWDAKEHDTFLLNQETVAQLLQIEIGKFEPIPVDNKTWFQNITARLDATTNSQFLIAELTIDGSVNTCLFHRKDIEKNGFGKYTLYHNATAITINLLQDNQWAFRVEVTQVNSTWAEQNTIQSTDSLENIDQGLILEWLRWTKQLKDQFWIDAQLENSWNILLRDNKWNLFGTITPSQYSDAYLKHGGVSYHMHIVKSSNGAIRIMLRGVWNHQASIEANRLDWPFFSSQWPTWIPWIEYLYTPEKNWFIGTLSLHKWGKNIGSLMIKNLDPLQIQAWKNIEAQNHSPESYQWFMSVWPIVLEWKQYQWVATSDTLIPWKLKIALIDMTTKKEGIRYVKESVTTTNRTVWTWMNDPVYDNTWKVNGLRVFCLQFRDMYYDVTSEDLLKIQKNKQSVIVNKKLQGIEYAITLRNEWWILVVSVDQITPMKDITDLKKRRKELEKPIPTFPVPEKKTEKKKEEQQENPWEKEEDYVVHEEDPKDNDVLPTIENNPRWNASVNTEKIPDWWLNIGWKKITWFYEYPLPFAGANQTDLNRYYFDHEWKSKFSLMYDIALSPINDDKWKEDLDLSKNAPLLNGKLFTMKDDKSWEWLVKAYLSPEGKLWFFLRPPLNMLKNQSYKEGVIDGPPQSLQRPSDDYTFKISSGMSKYGLQSKTKPRAWHSWVDITGDFDTNVLAPAGAEVVFVHDAYSNPSSSTFKRKSNWDYEWWSWFWNYLVLKLPNNCYVLMGHLSPNIPVKPWQRVPAWFPLAKMWRTWHVITWNPSGRWGVHLHLEYFRGKDMLMQFTASEFFNVFAPWKWYKKYIKERFEPESLLMWKSQFTTSSRSKESESNKNTNNAISPIEHKVWATQTGYATVYDTKLFEGKLTASEKVFRQKSNMAAHNSLPFGTEVEVTNLENNKTTRVVIEDNWSFWSKEGSQTIIDLSEQSMNEIGAWKIQVRIKVIKLWTKENPKDKQNNESMDIWNYLKNAPEYRESSFTRKNPKTWKITEYKSYKTRLFKNIGENRLGEESWSIPFGWLIAVDQNRVYLITKNEKKEITWASSIKINNITYVIDVDKDNSNAKYPKSALFNLKKQ